MTTSSCPASSATTSAGVLWRGDRLRPPSPAESFGIVLLEAWTKAKPVLVNGHCAVTAGHARRSRGGLAYRDYADFEAALEILLGEPQTAATLGANGRACAEGFGWDSVMDRYQLFLERVAGGGGYRRSSVSGHRIPTNPRVDDRTLTRGPSLGDKWSIWRLFTQRLARGTDRAGEVLREPSGIALRQMAANSGRLVVYRAYLRDPLLTSTARAYLSSPSTRPTLLERVADPARLTW